MFISCFQCFLFRFLGADSRSRRARTPWIVRSVDMFLYALAPLAQSYCAVSSPCSPCLLLRSVDMFLYALAPLAQSYLCGLILGGVKRESQRS